VRKGRGRKREWGGEILWGKREREGKGREGRWGRHQLTPLGSPPSFCSFAAFFLLFCAALYSAAASWSALDLMIDEVRREATAATPHARMPACRRDSWAEEEGIGVIVRMLGVWGW
jgi:hypothetical protein